MKFTSSTFRRLIEKFTLSTTISPLSICKISYIDVIFLTFSTGKHFGSIFLRTKCTNFPQEMYLFSTKIFSTIMSSLFTTRFHFFQQNVKKNSLTFSIFHQNVQFVHKIDNLSTKNGFNFKVSHHYHHHSDHQRHLHCYHSSRFYAYHFFPRQ